jgi:hypothetical protein
VCLYIRQKIPVIELDHLINYKNEQIPQGCTCDILGVRLPGGRRLHRSIWVHKSCQRIKQGRDSGTIAGRTDRDDELRGDVPAEQEKEDCSCSYSICFTW